MKTRKELHESRRLAILAALVRADGPTAAKAIRRDFPRVSWAELWRALDRLRRDGLAGRHRDASVVHGVGYLYGPTEAGRRRVASGAAARLGTASEALRDERGRRREAVREAYFALVRGGIYPSVYKLKDLTGIHQKQCLQLRRELEDSGAIPPEDEWPEAANALRCRDAGEARRIWRRAAILRGIEPGRSRRLRAANRTLALLVQGVVPAPPRGRWKVRPAAFAEARP